MNILLIDASPDLEESLQALGHTTRNLRLGGGIFHLPGILAKAGFSPDFVLQQESLGPRSYFGGLEQLSCPTIFWAIDVHLNMFWHKWYALLFDAVLTPHMSLFEALPPLWQPSVLQRFAQTGQQREWQGHAGRSHFMSFCARVDAHRPVRAWLVDLLKDKGLHSTDGLSHPEMMGLYDDSRVVPNESIANEVNFRLMEGASSGCLVLSPDVGEDQNSLLTPGKEFLIYHNGVELLEQVTWAKSNPDAVEKIGRAAMQRIQAEHLPEHRARTLVQLAEGLSQHRLSGPAATLAFWLTLAKQTRNGLLTIGAEGHAEQGLALVNALSGWNELSEELRPFVSHTVAQSLYLLAGSPGSGQPRTEEALSLCRKLLADAGEAGNAASAAPGCTLEVACAASALALREGLFTLAQAFWACYSGPGNAPLPKEPWELCLAWAQELRKKGHSFQIGFRFDPNAGSLPEVAFEYLLFAEILAPDSGDMVRHCENLLAGDPALIAMHLGYLAHRCLRDQKNWRIQLQYGLTCLQACRVDEGIFEITQAGKQAAAAGKIALFKGMLAAKDPQGYILKMISSEVLQP